MKLGSLFSGAGMLDYAVEHVFNARTVWHCELDPAASKVLAHRFPGVPNHHDITKVDWSTVEPVDILCGGFPCTDVSAAGKRAGLHNTRSGLWSYMRDAIDALRPQYVVIENVRGLLNANANRPMEPETDAVGNGDSQPVLRAIGAVLGDLADIGAYDARWVTVSAASIGAPHKRERVFILATDTGHRYESQWARTPRRVREERSPVGAVFGRGSEDTGGRPEPARLVGGSDAALSGDGPVDLLPTPRSSDCFGAGLHGDGGMDLRTTVSLLQTPSTADGDGSRKARGGDRSNEPLLPGQAVEMATAWGKYEPAIRRWEQLTRPAPSPTEPNRNGNPRLAAAFSEWMLGWPAGWVTKVPGVSRNDALRIVGNGVCPQQATAALRWLLNVAEIAA